MLVLCCGTPRAASGDGAAAKPDPPETTRLHVRGYVLDVPAGWRFRQRGASLVLYPSESLELELDVRILKRRADRELVERLYSSTRGRISQEERRLIKQERIKTEKTEDGTLRFKFGFLFEDITGRKCVRVYHLVNAPGRTPSVLVRTEGPLAQWKPHRSALRKVVDSIRPQAAEKEEPERAVESPVAGSEPGGGKEEQSPIVVHSPAEYASHSSGYEESASGDYDGGADSSVHYASASAVGGTFHGALASSGGTRGPAHSPPASFSSRRSGGTVHRSGGRATVRTAKGRKHRRHGRRRHGRRRRRPARKGGGKSGGRKAEHGRVPGRRRQCLFGAKGVDMDTLMDASANSAVEFLDEKESTRLINVLSFQNPEERNEAAQRRALGFFGYDRELP